MLLLDNLNTSQLLTLADIYYFNFDFSKEKDFEISFNEIIDSLVRRVSITKDTLLEIISRRQTIINNLKEKNE